MNIYIVLILTLSATADSMDSKSINLNLKTSILIHPKDVRNNKTAILELKTLFDKIGNLLNIRTKSEEKHFAFSDFLQNIADTFVKYDDKDLKSLRDTVYSTINNLKGRKSSSLFADDNLKISLNKILNEYKIKEPDEIRSDIKKILKGDNEKVLVDFTSHLNNFFNKNDGKHLYEISKIFSRTKDKKLLKNFVRNALNYAFNDFYNSLNDTSQVKLFNELKKVGKYLSNNTTDEKKETGLEDLINNVDSDDVTRNDNDNSLERLIQLITNQNK